MNGHSAWLVLLLAIAVVIAVLSILRHVQQS